MRLTVFALAAAAMLVGAAASSDKLGRDNPRSAVISFLQACRRQDYDTASQYLDLRNVPEKSRQETGAEMARKLEAALNSAPGFNVLQVSQNPDGSSADGSVAREQIASLSPGGITYSIDLERITLPPGTSPVWVFSSSTVAAVQGLNLSMAAPWVEHYLPAFMSSVEFLETPLWAWMALVLAAAILISLARFLDRLLLPIFRSAGERMALRGHWEWTEALLRPVRMILSLALFRCVVGVIHPSLIAQLYIGRFLELLLIWSIAWCLVRIVDLLLNRVESNFASRQEFGGRSILRLGRRTASATIVILAILILLGSWGYNTATLIAGLGVGGIAVALAAQQTIANVFGGVSVIGDHPVGIGEFGKFGDLVGTVEDIGMRSTRVRTLNRTLVSVPNSTFAGANLENYSVRDKILFNPTFQIKRSTPDDEVWHLIDSIHKALEQNHSVELVPTPVRLIGLTAAAFNIEVFCYVLTHDIDQFYKIQGQLLFAINDALMAAHLELV